MAASYPLLWRSRCLTWGASANEAASPLRGDELIPDADLVTTRAIAIGAPREKVWPWLVQMGSGRAGSYAYDWPLNLFGLDMHSADVILPQFQDLKEGDERPIGAATLRVAALVPDHLLVTWVPTWNWVRIFRLIDADGATRLLIRDRIAYPGMNGAKKLGHRVLIELGGLVMERKMLRGIKERAEGDACQAWPSAWASGSHVA